MILSAIKWLAFLWGCLMLTAMGYYAVHWFPHATDIRYNEVAIGFHIAAIYGWPSWFALPAIAIAQRKELPHWHVALLIAPALLAVALYTVGLLLSEGVL